MALLRLVAAATSIGPGCSPVLVGSGLTLAGVGTFALAEVRVSVRTRHACNYSVG